MSEEQDESLSVHSPYYLWPSENPAIALVSPLLDPTNYNSWSRSSFTTLSAENKVEFVMVPFLDQPRIIDCTQLGKERITWWFHGLYTQLQLPFVKASYGWTTRLISGKI